MYIFSDFKKQQSDEIEQALASLPEDERDFFEERAAIMAYDGGLSREEAERRALEIVAVHSVRNAFLTHSSPLPRGSAVNRSAQRGVSGLTAKISTP